MNEYVDERVVTDQASPFTRSGDDTDARREKWFTVATWQ